MQNTERSRKKNSQKGIEKKTGQGLKLQGYSLLDSVLGFLSLQVGDLPGSGGRTRSSLKLE